MKLILEKYGLDNILELFYLMLYASFKGEQELVCVINNELKEHNLMGKFENYWAGITYGLYQGEILEQKTKAIEYFDKYKKEKK